MNYEGGYWNWNVVSEKWDWCPDPIRVEGTCWNEPPYPENVCSSYESFRELANTLSELLVISVEEAAETRDRIVELEEGIELQYGEISDLQAINEAAQASFIEVVKISEGFHDEVGDLEKQLDGCRAFYYDAMLLRRELSKELKGVTEQRDQALEASQVYYDQLEEVRNGEGEIFIAGKRLWENMATGEWSTDPENKTGSVPNYRPSEPGARA